jgi:hypothetical protein
MSRLSPLLLGSCLLLGACNSRSDSGQPAAAADPTAGPTPAAAPAALVDSPGAWYRQYRGLLPGSADSITLHLQAWPRLPNDTESAGMQGSYAGADGHPYELLGDVEVPVAADSVVLTDYSPEHNPGDANGGITWRLRREDDGQLTGTVGGQPVRLRPVQPLGSVALAARFYQDSVAAYPGQASSPHATMRLLALLPAGPAATLQANLLRHLRGDTTEAQPAPALDSLWRQQLREYARDYRLDAQERSAESEELPGYALSYDSQTITHVYWNQAPLLSLGYLRYSYSGGAHGGYSTQVVTYDTRTGRPLHYEDIFRPTAEAPLRALLEATARRTFHLAPGAALDEVLFEKHLPVTRNVFLTSGGAVFVYAPYEIASFAQGEIRLFVPLQQLRPLLQPSLPLDPEVARR